MKASQKSGDAAKKKTGGGFQSYNLSPEVYKAVQQKGYSLPTPIQRRAIPIILQGFNVIAMARTGSGKTAAFTIPVVERLRTHSEIVGARALILSPTRELAMQSAYYFKQMSKYTDLTHCLIVGGNDMENQFERLLLNPDVIIATPGRLMHCITQTGLQLSQVQMVVFDEADRLFELGFADQIKTITQKMPPNRQSLLFSATISSQVREFTLAGMTDYRMVQVDRDSKLSDQLKLHFYVVRTAEKEAALFYILREHVKLNQQTIVFCATKYHVEYLNEVCQKGGFSCDYIFGAMDQRSREDKLYKFRKKFIKVLLVTDLAARGIDIPLLENVIHYDFPTKMKLFIHRSGRTARAGQTGTSYSIVSQDEIGYMNDLSIFVGRRHFDKPVNFDKLTTEEERNAAMEELIANPQKICYGTLPQHLLDEYNSQVARLYSIHKEVLEPFKKSIRNAMTKYQKTKDPVSQASLQSMRKLHDGNPVAVHPALICQVDEKEHALFTFKQQLSSYKPKQSVLENVIVKSQDFARINTFQDNLEQQRVKTEEKREREANEKHAREVVEAMEKIEERKRIDLEVKSKINDQVLAMAAVDQGQQGKKKLSKRAQKKLDKSLTNKNISDLEKQIMIDEATGVGSKGQKRQKMDDYRDANNFISGQRSTAMQEGDRETAKVNKSSLWDDHERAFLDDVTLNLIPDDEHMNTTGKTVMKWDKVKKRYTLQKVDREGRVMKEKRNEAGRKISKKMAMSKDPDSIYKKWQQKTHLSLQRSGEVENKKLMSQAKNANESRAMMKQFKGSHHDLNKGEDVRNPGKLMKSKEKKLSQKTKNMTKEERRPTQSRSQSKVNEPYTGGKNVSQKAKNKIVAGMRPTRSKIIVKTAGREGGSTRGRGGRGSSRGGSRGGGRGGSRGRGGRR